MPSRLLHPGMWLLCLLQTGVAQRTTSGLDQMSNLSSCMVDMTSGQPYGSVTAAVSLTVWDSGLSKDCSLHNVSLHEGDEESVGREVGVFCVPSAWLFCSSAPTLLLSLRFPQLHRWRRQVVTVPAEDLQPSPWLVRLSVESTPAADNYPTARTGQNRSRPDDVPVPSPPMDTPTDLPPTPSPTPTSIPTPTTIPSPISTTTTTTSNGTTIGKGEDEQMHGVRVATPPKGRASEFQFPTLVTAISVIAGALLLSSLLATLLWRVRRHSAWLLSGIWRHRRRRTPPSPRYPLDPLATPPSPLGVDALWKQEGHRHVEQELAEQHSGQGDRKEFESETFV